MGLSKPFSTPFWVCYLCGGLSDLLDGAVARKLKVQSPAGARLDSMADMVFAVALAVAVVRKIKFPVWTRLCAACIAALRFVSYGIGAMKYRTFVSLHTYANKATGALIFLFPVLYAVLGRAATSVLLCAVALASSVEELIITAKSRQLDRDCRSVFLH